MKTKIIYISGGDIFDIQDVRSAFEEVRNAVGLSEDTVLFGVPVDSEESCINSEKPETVKKVKTTKKIEFHQKIQLQDPEEKVTIESEEKIIPILSVLNTNNKINNFQEPEEQIQVDEKIEENQPVDSETFIEQEFIIEESIEIENAINDEIPEVSETEEEEQTLEQLLEKMAPLREDNRIKEEVIFKTDSSSDAADLTLEQLAAEFAEKEDQIVITEKNENSGKIGKLKNILPFKKAKREDSSLMGDLFGWAGIAANDDEFSMPEFFTNATSSKK